MLAEILATLAAGMIVAAVVAACVFWSYYRDRYRGVAGFSRLVRREQTVKWIQNDGKCHRGQGAFCHNCDTRERCYSECEEKVKRQIDAEVENGKH